MSKQEKEPQGPFVQRTSNLFAENRLLKFTVLVIGTCSVLSAFMSYKALTYQTVVIVPPQVNQKMWVTGNKASNEYVSEFSRYVASLSLSYMYGLGRDQFSELITLFHPTVQPERRKEYYALSDRINETKAIQSFFISKILPDQNNKTVELSGIQRLHIGERLAEEGQKTYVIHYVIESGKFQITRIVEKESVQNKKP